MLNGQTGLAMGNVVGSNIFNVLFILGLSALIAPLVVHVQIIRQEVPILMGASLLLLVLGLDGRISLTDAALLFDCCWPTPCFWSCSRAVKHRPPRPSSRPKSTPPLPAAWDARLPVQIALIVAGLALLVLGSDWLVGAAVVFAKALGVSDLVIGLTIVAAGTSMPEVATSVAAALRASATSPWAMWWAAALSTFWAAWGWPGW